jgi:methyl-accepting chemotaxis protein
MRREDARQEVVSEIQRGFGRAFVAFLWVNALLVVGVGHWRETLGLDISVPVVLALAAVPTLMWCFQGAGGSTPVVGSIALACFVALLVAAFRSSGGMSLQIDMHMYFFACMAICVGWLNWRAILAFGAFVAAHHTLVGLADAGAVFPDGYTLGRLGIHAGIVALEGVVLIWIIRHLLHSLSTSREALSASRLSADETDRLRIDAEGRSVADARWRAEFERAAEALQRKVGDLGRQADGEIARLNATAGLLSELAGQTMRQVGDAKNAAGDAVSFVRQVAHSAAALAEAERDISRQAHQTSGSIRSAAETARNTSQRVERLADAARRIGDVVRLIENVASQTNLLALNATIEAARAGASGRGFAVVAQEVKTLAAQTAKSTADIAGLATVIRDAAAEALSSVTSIETVMGEIDGAASSIVGALDQQGASTEGISRNAAHMVRGTELVVGAIAGVTGAAEKASGAATHVEDATGSVALAIAELTRAVDSFLADVLPKQAA